MHENHVQKRSASNFDSLTQESPLEGKSLAPPPFQLVATAAAPPNAGNSPIPGAQPAKGAAPQNYLDAVTICNMRVGEFEKYVSEQQADWYASPKLTDFHRDAFRVVLKLSRQPEMMSGLYDMKVSDLAGVIELYGYAGALETLRHYCEAVRQKPFSYTKSDDAFDALKAGLTIGILKTAFPDWVLATAMKDWVLDMISRRGLAQDLVDYYQLSNPTPTFQAITGRDFLSYIEMRAQENPLKFNKAPLSGKVRNYHRFHPEIFPQLITNYEDKSRKRPLVIILHSGMDHNGAFHRDEGIKKLVGEAKNNVLMIEGKESLAELSAEVPTLASEYGIHGKIDQVMMAGHGGPQEIEMAGKVEEDISKGGIHEKSETFGTSKANPESEKLLTAILDNMDKKGDGIPNQKHSRIDFNACLTNANSLGGMSLPDFSPESAAMQYEIFRRGIVGPNLVDYANDKAKTNKNDGVKAVGSDGSFTTAEYLNKDGGLDIISKIDPALTASKIEYVKLGVDPFGALLALLECWADDRKTAKVAVQARVATKPKGWNEILIKSLFEQALLDWESGELINQMSAVAMVVSELKSEANCRPSKFKKLQNFDASILEKVFSDLGRSQEWLDRDYIPLVVYQGLISMSGSLAKAPDFLDMLETLFDCQTAFPFVDPDYLTQGRMLQQMLSLPPTPGLTMLALIGVIQDAKAFYCNVYLLKLLDKDKKFPAALGVQKLLGGLATEEEVLIKILGLPAVAAASSNNAANLSTNGAAENQVLVSSVTMDGTVKMADCTVYEDLAMKNPIGMLHAGDVVHIAGVAGEMLVIEYAVGGKLGTAFVETYRVRRMV